MFETRTCLLEMKLSNQIQDGKLVPPDDLRCTSLLLPHRI